MPKPRPFQWYYSPTELIWPDGPFKLQKDPSNKFADTHNKFKFAQSALQVAVVCVFSTYFKNFVS